MDQGWIQTFAAETAMPNQLSVATGGGSDTALPNLSIEIDDLEQALQLFIEADVPIEYGPVDEPWGVRRIYVRDPFGSLLNIMQHL